MARLWLIGSGLFVAIFWLTVWVLYLAIHPSILNELLPHLLLFLIVLSKIPLEALLFEEMLAVPRTRARSLALTSGLLQAGIFFIVPFQFFSLSSRWIVQLNGQPSPFLTLLFLGAVALVILSAISLGVWNAVAETSARFRWVLVVQAVAVGLGMGCALMPDRPYANIETHVRVKRGDRMHVLVGYVQDTGRFPRAATTADFARELREKSPVGRFDPKAASLYMPKFGRFDLGVDRGVPYLWNSAMSGLAVADIPEGYTWLFKHPTRKSQEIFVIRHGDRIGFGIRRSPGQIRPVRPFLLTAKGLEYPFDLTDEERRTWATPEYDAISGARRLDKRPSKRRSIETSGR